MLVPVGPTRAPSLQKTRALSEFRRLPPSSTLRGARKSPRFAPCSLPATDPWPESPRPHRLLAGVVIPLLCLDRPTSRGRIGGELHHPVLRFPPALVAILSARYRCFFRLSTYWCRYVGVSTSTLTVLGSCWLRVCTLQDTN